MSNETLLAVPAPPRPFEHRVTRRLREVTVDRYAGGNAAPQIDLDGPHELVSRLVRDPAPGRGTGLRRPLFFIRDCRGLVRFEPEDVLFIQADGNYVEVHFCNRRAVLRNSLSEVMKLLPDGILIQVNRAQGVNLRRLSLVGSDEVQLGELTFTLSRRFRDDLLGRLDIISGR